MTNNRHSKMLIQFSSNCIYALCLPYSGLHVRICLHVLGNHGNAQSKNMPKIITNQNIFTLVPTIFVIYCSIICIMSWTQSCDSCLMKAQ